MYIWILILSTAVWVLYDAKTIGVKKGLVGGMGNMGPWAWAIVTAFLWIVGFPMYLYYRGKFKAALAVEKSDAVPTGFPPPAKNVSYGGSLDDLQRLGELRQKNLITEDEFAAKKKQILGI